jgi:hypothetical protein
MSEPTAWPSLTIKIPFGPPAPYLSCRVYWGSHGCDLPRGHPADQPHDCGCCECGEHHPYPDWPDENVLCVSRPPYYGPDTKFYGEDAEALGLPLVGAE